MKLKRLEERFNKMDENEHTDYRIIAKTLAYDYHKLSNKYKKLQKEKEELKKKLENAEYKISVMTWATSFELHD